MIHFFIALFSLLFHWQSSVVSAQSHHSEVMFSSHRILAYVVTSDEQRAEIAETVERLSAQIVDRDMLLINLGEIEVATKHSVAMGVEEKRRWLENWNIDLGKSSFVLIGKDGGAKAVQRDELDLPALFDLIDTMPMRRAEMRAKSRSAAADR